MRVVGQEKYLRGEWGKPDRMVQRGRQVFDFLRAFATVIGLKAEYCERAWGGGMVRPG